MEGLQLGSVCWAICLACLVTVAYYLCKCKSRFALPGPNWRLPVIGHLHLLLKKPHLALTEMQRWYGNIFTLDLGPNSAVILCGKKTIKKACADPAFSGRPHRLFNSWRKHQRYFAFGHDEVCLRYRKLTMKAISTFTKQHLEQLVHTEANQLISKLCVQTDLLMHSHLVCRSVANVSYYMCFGRIKSQSDIDFLQVTQSVENILNFASQAGFADTFPWATWIPSVNAKYKKFLQSQDDLVRLVREQERAHLTNDILSVDGYQDLCDNLKDAWSKDNLKNVVTPNGDFTVGTASEQTGMLLVAGSETVATSLNWAILLLATHPAEQENLFHELDEDKSHGQMGSRMEAFLLETLRFSMASPLAMPHYTLKDTTLDGYKIPKDMLVLVNLWSGSRDRAVWGNDADVFRPARFLNDFGQVDQTLAEEISAFGSGKRRCAGEQLARAELRLFLRDIVGSCIIELAEPGTEVDYWSSTAVRNRPPVVPLKFLER